MRALLLLLAFVPCVAWSQSVRPDISSTSPDQQWKVTAHWIKDAGYASQLENLKTGKVFFRDDKVSANTALPHQITALWSPDSHYVAMTFYYGRAVEDVTVYAVSGSQPEDLSMPWTLEKASLDTQLVKEEDWPAYTDYNHLLVAADHWENASDLAVNIDFLAELSDKKSGDKSRLSASYTKSVRFSNDAGQVIATTCNSYDKTPEPPSK